MRILKSPKHRSLPSEDKASSAITSPVEVLSTREDSPVTNEAGEQNPISIQVGFNAVEAHDVDAPALSKTGNKRGSRRDQVSALHKGIELLARREHSVHELTQKLRAKGYSHNEVDSAIESLTSENLVCDERFTEAYIRARLNRGMGPLKIWSELRQKGVDDSLVQALTEASGVNWDQQALAIYESKFGFEAPSDSKEWNKRARFMQSRGFSPSTIRSVCPDIAFSDD